MKLRTQLSVVFAGVTSLTVASALALTLTVFRHAQERQLDQALLASALFTAADVGQRGARGLSAAMPGDIAPLIKYSAVFRPDGSLLWDTPLKGGRKPVLGDTGYQAEESLPRGGFNVRLRGGPLLRGVLVPVRPPAPDDGERLLLMLASRGDEDADVQHLLRVMAAVLAGAAALSLLLGWIAGRSMSRGIETVAAMARRVAQGELSARVPVPPIPELGRQDEIISLATDLNHMVDRLAALRAAEQRFVSHAAHELRSPLAALRGELELALRHPRSEADYQDAIREALDSTNRLIALAEDLLALARVGARGPGEESCASLGQVVEQAVRASRVRAGAEQRVEVQVEDAQVPGRAADLSRMVRNLIDNALAHAPAGTSVRVTAGRVEDHAEIAVEDAGPGVPEPIRERIFDPFFRGEREAGEPGAGLGLSIAREIACVHGGDLTLRCEPGRTRFVARLRLRRPTL